MPSLSRFYLPDTLIQCIFCKRGLHVVCLIIREIDIHLMYGYKIQIINYLGNSSLINLFMASVSSNKTLTNAHLSKQERKAILRLYYLINLLFVLLCLFFPFLFVNYCFWGKRIFQFWYWGGNGASRFVELFL